MDQKAIRHNPLDPLGRGLPIEYTEALVHRQEQLVLIDGLLFLSCALKPVQGFHGKVEEPLQRTLSFPVLGHIAQLPVVPQFASILVV